MAMQLNNFVLESGIAMPYHILFHTVTIGYPQIWETARDMRTALPQYVSLYSQNYSLYPEGPKCPVPDQQQKRDQINFLYQLQNDTSYLQYVTSTLDSYAEAGYAQSITDDFIREVYHSLPVLFKVEDKTVLAAMSDTLSHLHSCYSGGQMNQQIRISIENMLQTQSSAAGSEHLYYQLKHYIEVNIRPLRIHPVLHKPPLQKRMRHIPPPIPDQSAHHKSKRTPKHPGGHRYQDHRLHHRLRGCQIFQPCLQK